MQRLVENNGKSGARLKLKPAFVEPKKEPKKESVPEKKEQVAEPKLEAKKEPEQVIKPTEPTVKKEVVAEPAKPQKPSSALAKERMEAIQKLKEPLAKKDKVPPLKEEKKKMPEPLLDTEFAESSPVKEDDNKPAESVKTSPPLVDLLEDEPVAEKSIKKEEGSGSKEGSAEKAFADQIMGADEEEPSSDENKKKKRNIRERLGLAQHSPEAPGQQPEPDTLAEDEHEHPHPEEGTN